MLAYEFIHDVLGDEIDPDASAWLDASFVKPQRIATIVVCVCAAVVVGAIALASFMPSVSVATTLAVYAAIVVAVIFFVRVYKLRNSFARTMPRVMDQEVDPALFGRRYLAYVRQQRAKDVLGCSWNYARALRWQGRRDDARRLMQAYLDRFGDKRVAEKVLVHASFGYCAFDALDAAELRREVDYLEALGDRGVTQMMESTRAQLASYCAVLESMDDPATRADAYAVLEDYFQNATPLQKVEFAYLLAVCSDHKNERSRWITYASSHAGTTWLGKAARALRG